MIITAGEMSAALLITFAIWLFVLILFRDLW
jgi:hypothetical protein